MRPHLPPTGGVCGARGACARVGYALLAMVEMAPDAKGDVRRVPWRLPLTVVPLGARSLAAPPLEAPPLDVPPLARSPRRLAAASRMLAASLPPSRAEMLVEDS